MKITGLIAAKGTSERVKNKNIRPFSDTSLVELKLKQLKLVHELDDVLVSSEDKQILELAQSMGYNIHVRSPKYSTSNVPMSDVYKYLADEVSGDAIAWIQVNNPLVCPSRYNEAIHTYRNLTLDYDCLLSVNDVKKYLFYDGKPINFKPYPWAKSQDLTNLCELNFAVCILKREDMIRWGSLVGDHPYFFFGDSEEFTDIDDLSAFRFCEMIYNQKKQEILGLI